MSGLARLLSLFWLIEYHLRNRQQKHTANPLAVSIKPILNSKSSIINSYRRKNHEKIRIIELTHRPQRNVDMLKMDKELLVV